MGIGPTYSDDDYVAAMLALGRRGRAWPTEPDTARVAVSKGLAQSYVRSGSRAVNLVSDAFPATTSELIPEWEATLGLPDPCTPLNPSTEQRKAAILAKFIGSGGQSVAYFVSIAAALGFTITITEFATFRLGISRLGDALCGPGWDAVWQVNAPTITAVRFKLGVSRLGDPFWTIGNTELECRIRALAPAQTKVNFVYS